MNSALLQYDSLINVLNGHLSANQDIPIFSAVALKIRNLVHKEECHIHDVERLISQDAGLAGQILRIANSSYYGGHSKVATINAAILRLGLKQIANVAMTVSQRAMYRSNDKFLNTYMDRLRNHAISCAIGAQWLATNTGRRQLASEAFMAGLLHDIGKLRLIKAVEEVIAKSSNNGVSGNSEIAQALFGTTDLAAACTVDLAKNHPPRESLIQEAMRNLHAKAGFQLLRAWNLPETYCVVVRDHHNEVVDKDNVLLLIVRLVDRVTNNISDAYTIEEIVASDEAQLLGVSEDMLLELDSVVKKYVQEF